MGQAGTCLGMNVDHLWDYISSARKQELFSVSDLLTCSLTIYSIQENVSAQLWEVYRRYYDLLLQCPDNSFQIEM